MRDDDRGADPTAATFVDALAALKRRGSTLLVVGPEPAALSEACDRLLGNAVTEPRRRLLVRTGGAAIASVGGSGPAGAGQPTRTIRYETAPRSASVATADATTPVPTRTVESGLDDLHRAVVEEVDHLTPADEDLAPSELRVCVDSLDELLELHGSEPVFEFLHALSGTVADTRAMCHAHLPAAYEDETTSLLAPLFDAVIEVRSDGRQRWHLSEPDLTTDWLAL